MPISDEIRLVAGRFGSRLKELRKDAGLTQKQLADAAGVSQPLVAEYEANRYTPAWDVALALAHALGVPVESFAAAPKRNKDAD